MALRLSSSAQKIDTILYFIKFSKLTDWPSFNSEIVVNNKDSADFYRLILSPDTTTDRNLFVVNDFYINGRPKMVAKTNSQNYWLNLNGACVKYFPNGRRKSIENYNHGKLTGYTIKYYPNGKPYLTGMYNDSSRLVVDECRDSTGKALAQNGNGHYIIYDEAFKQIQSEGEILNGLENGEWRGVLGDTITYVCTYVEGMCKNGISRHKNGKEYIFSKAQEYPMFKGGMQAFYGFLAREIRYPKVARDLHIQGKVFLTFTIDRDGSLNNITVVQGAGGGIDEEALRVIKQSPKWQPGKLYGVPVRVQYTMPISFTLSYENR